MSYTLIGEEGLLQRAAPGELVNSRVLLLDHSSAGSANDWVVESASRLLRRLREDAAAGLLDDRRTIVLASFPAVRTADEIAHRAATVQSLRGIVQSVTREYAHRLSPLNLVVVDRESLDDAAGTIRFLDASDGSYTAGSTIDLTNDGGTA